jgi:EpsI family protein
MTTALMAYRRFVAILLSMMLASIISVCLIPTKKVADLQAKVDLSIGIPLAFGDWRIDESTVPIDPSPVQQEKLNQIYEQTVSRSYINSDGQRIMLAIAYGSSQTQQLRAHRQEVCYSAQGFTIKSLHNDQAVIAGVSIPVTRMLAVQGTRIEPVTYWFTMGTFVVRSHLDRQLAQFRYALSGMIPDGFLVRVSSITPDADTAYATQIQFLQQLFDSISPDLRAKLRGNV